MSFIFGLFAVFFFEINNHLFLIFIVLSVCFDLLDGAFASIENKNEKAKKRGMLYDDISDRSVFILLILKIAFILKSFPVLLIALAYLLIKSVHILLKQKHSNKIQILYFDRLSLPILLFSYDIFFQVLVLVLFINILELLNILQEKNQ
jgi:phosphatidylglycerophosphate synthase